MSGVIRFIKAFGKRFNEAQVSLRAAALAYHTLLGIVPIVGLVFWYLNAIGVTDLWISLLRGFLLDQLNIDSGEPFVAHFDRLTAHVRGRSWGIIGAVLLVYTAWNLISKFGDSLDAILAASGHTTEKNIPSWRLALRRLIVMVALPVATTMSLVMTNWIRKESWFRSVLSIKTVGPYAALPIAWTAGITASFLIYSYIPRYRVRWYRALRVAFFVAPTGELIRFLFGRFNVYAVSTQKIYGVFAVVPMFIFWVQLSWMVLLVGALFLHSSRDHSRTGHSVAS